MYVSGALWRWVWLLVLAAVTIHGAYIPSFSPKKSDKLHRKSNAIYHTKRYGPAFKDDWDIVRYLKLFGSDMMLWRCKNAIQPYWDWKPLPVVELYCEVIGTLKSVSWFRNGEKLELGERYAQVATPHYTNDQYFSRWINFRLKIFNATMADSGIYTFQVTSPKDLKQEQMIYVDISEKKRKRDYAIKKRKERGGKTHKLARHNTKLRSANRKIESPDTKETKKKRRKHRKKQKSRKKKRNNRKKKKWDYFSYRKLHNNHIYIEP